MSARRATRLAVCIVTHDDADDLPACLEAVAAMAAEGERPLRLVVADCASRDASLATARAFRASGVATTVLPLGENRGYAGGMNAALAALDDVDWVLALNADARPEPDYAERLIARAEAHPEVAVGAVTGRLRRFPPAAGEPQRLDACGMILLPTWRHLDRGSGEVDRGQHARAERVFGGTGAATLFSRRALDDVAIEGDVFDPLFHSFREDAELAFRLHERGWEVLYEPAARCRHRRTNLPSRRRAMPARVNHHSLKNRYLLRLYHQSLGNFFLTLPATLWRDLLALGWVLVAERTSLGAYAWLWRRRREILARSRTIRRRRTAPRRTVERWFWRRSLPLPQDRRPEGC